MQIIRESLRNTIITINRWYDKSDKQAGPVAPLTNYRLAITKQLCIYVLMALYCLTVNN